MVLLHSPAGQEGRIVNFEMKASRPVVWKVLQPAPQWALAMESELSALFNSKNHPAAPMNPESLIE